MENIYYKIVSTKVVKRKKRYFSCIVMDNNEIEYFKNEWTKAPDGNKYKYLTCFSTLKDVSNFLESGINDHVKYKFHVYKCLIKDELELKKFPIRYVVTNGNINYYYYYSDPNWPKGTIMAEQVKIFGNKINIEKYI